MHYIEVGHSLNAKKVVFKQVGYEYMFRILTKKKEKKEEKK